MIEKIDVRLLGWAKTIWSCGIFSRAVELISTFDKVTFSGQDEVRTSSLIASVTMWHSAFKSRAPTELADWCFMLLKIDRDCHFLDCQFTLSIIIAYHHSSPKHQLSLFEVAPSYIELYFHGLVTYSLVDCEAEFSSSLNYSIGSSGFSFTSMTCYWIGLMVEKMW